MSELENVSGTLIPELDEIATRVADATEGTSDAARLMRQKLDAIRSISAIIRSVAAQSKLLALNAAIEAARAGNEGRGFGVVASEMRALATQAEKGAHEIDACIDEALAAATQSDDAIAALGNAVEQGLVVVGQLIAANASDGADLLKRLKEKE